jgi:hypothetical protein
VTHVGVLETARAVVMVLAGLALVGMAGRRRGLSPAA